MLGGTVACQSGHYRVALLPLVWLTILRTIYGYFLAMVSDGQVHVLNEGDSITLECSFHADGYSLFDYPVLWRKTQRGEDTQMNIMGNINEPFASTNRFEVAFTALAPRYKFELSILDVTQVDSGNYTCEIRGPYSSILGQSTHQVYVRDDEPTGGRASDWPCANVYWTSTLSTAESTKPSHLDRIMSWRSRVPAAEAKKAEGASDDTRPTPRPPFLTGRLAWIGKIGVGDGADTLSEQIVKPPVSSMSAATGAAVESIVMHNSVSSSFISAPTTAPPGGGHVIHMVENHLVHIRCTTTGGYPPPTVELFVDRRDVTDDFALRQTSTFSGRRGLRQLTYRVERWSQSFRARMSDHNAWLKCIASVQGLAPVIESIRLNVDYAPKVTCSSAEANVDDTNVCIRCEIDAKPRSSSVTWAVDNNGTVLAEGQVFDGFSTISTEQSSGILEAQLCIRLVEPGNFRKYTLSVENEVATVATVAQLSERILKVNSAPLADSAASLHPSAAGTVNRTATSSSSSSTMSRDISRKNSFAKSFDHGAKPSSRSVTGFRSATTSITWTSKHCRLLAIASIIYSLSCHRSVFYYFRSLL